MITAGARNTRRVGELGCGAGIGEGARPRLAEGEPADHVTALITDAMQEGRAQPRLVVLGGRRVAADDEQTVRVVAHRVGGCSGSPGASSSPAAAARNQSSRRVMNPYMPSAGSHSVAVERYRHGK